MILHAETSKLMYNWSFLFEGLHKPTLLPSTFNTVKYQPHCKQSPHCEAPTVDHSVDTLARILKSDLTYISATCCYMQFS